MVKNLIDDKLKEEIFRFIYDLEQIEEDDIEHMKEDDIEHKFQFIDYAEHAEDDIICSDKDQKSQRDLADTIKFIHNKWWRNQMR